MTTGRTVSPWELPPNPWASLSKYLLLLLIGGAVLGSDLWTKQLVLTYLKRPVDDCWRKSSACTSRCRISGKLSAACARECAIAFGRCRRTLVASRAREKDRLATLKRRCKAVRRTWSGSECHVIPRTFWLRYETNKGVAWGMMASKPRSWRIPILVTLTLLALAFILYFYWRLSPRERVGQVAFSLVLGGALGNFADRISLGHVVDFVQVSISALGRTYHWPTFNVADVGITVGVALLLLDRLVLSRSARPPGGPAGTDESARDLDRGAEEEHGTGAASPPTG